MKRKHPRERNIYSLYRDVPKLEVLLIDRNCSEVIGIEISCSSIGGVH